MRIKHVPYNKHNLTTLDLVVQDEILYRDENYFNQVQDEIEEQYLDQVRKLSSVISEEEVNPEINRSATMTAPLEEHAETGPLIPCKVSSIMFEIKYPFMKNNFVGV